jgi:hypothetical protein
MFVVKKPELTDEEAKRIAREMQKKIRADIEKEEMEYE